MANLKSSIKDVRRTIRRTKKNNIKKATADKHVRAFKKSLADGKQKEAKKIIPAIQSAYDKMVRSKIMTKNKAARQKSRLALKLKKK